jgi:cadherin 23
VPTETGKIPIGRVPNTNKHSTEGSNPIWLKAYENEWYKNDDSFSQGSTGQDSLDENVLVNDERRLTDENFLRNMSKSKEINGLHTQNNLVKHLNMYQQIDKLANSSVMTKKLETTEL